MSACLPTCAPMAMNTASNLPASRSASTSSTLWFEHDLHAHALDPRDLVHQIGARQAIGGNAEMQHAAGQRPGLVDLHLMAQPRQMIGRRQAARPGADDQHAFAGGRRAIGTVQPSSVARSPRKRSTAWIDTAARVPRDCSRFARVIADAAVRRRQRIVLHQRFPGSPVFARLRQREPGLDILAGRAGVVARRQQRHVVRQTRPEGACPVVLRQIDNRGEIVRQVSCVGHQSLPGGDAAHLPLRC